MIDPKSLIVPEVLETPRLIVRCPQVGDGAAVREAVAESLEELRRWTLWAQEELPDVEETDRRQIAARETFLARTGFSFSLFRRDNGVFVGKCALFDVDWNVPKAIFGYWLRTSETGHGFMTEAVEAVETFAFETLGMVRLQIDCDGRNARSAGVAERLGYEREACLRCHGRDRDGHLTDKLIFSKIRR